MEMAQQTSEKAQFGDGNGGEAATAADGVSTFTFRSVEPIDPAAFAQFLSLIGSMLGPRLLRLKGLFALTNRPHAPILVDGVQHVFHAPRELPNRNLLSLFA